jgi:hypothetical protein
VCLSATAASPLARSGGGTRPLAGEEMASKRPAAGIKGLINLLRRSFRKRTAELTYRNRVMGSKLSSLNCKFGVSWELCSRIWGSRDSNFNRVTGYSDRILLLFLAFPQANCGILPSLHHDRSSKPALVCYS